MQDRQFNILPLTVVYDVLGNFTATVQLPNNRALGVVAIMGDQRRAALHQLTSITDGDVNILQIGTPAPIDLGFAGIRADAVISGAQPMGVRPWPGSFDPKFPLPGAAAFNVHPGQIFTVRGFRYGGVVGDNFPAAGLSILYFDYGMAEKRPLNPRANEPVIANVPTNWEDAGVVAGRQELRIRASKALANIVFTRAVFFKRNIPTALPIDTGEDYSIAIEPSTDPGDQIPFRAINFVVANQFGGSGDIDHDIPHLVQGGVPPNLWKIVVPDSEQLQLDFQSTGDAIAAAVRMDNVFFGYTDPF